MIGHKTVALLLLAVCDARADGVLRGGIGFGGNEEGGGVDLAALLPEKIEAADLDEIEHGLNLITGGKEVKPEDFPSYLVQISRGMSGHHCTASLIGSRTVLTAGHCFNCGKIGFERGFCEPAGSFRVPPNLWVNINRYDRTDNDGAIRHEICPTNDDGCDGLARVIRHPDYGVGRNLNNDIALIILNEPVPDSVTPVALNRGGGLPSELGDDLVAYGWGYIKFTKPRKGTNVPHTVTLGYIPNDMCTENGSFRTSSWQWNGHTSITNKMLCAYDQGRTSADDEDDTKSTRNGDSGGPLVIENTPDGQPIQVGVVSFGQPEFPNVFARVSAEYDWIAKTVCKEAGDLCCFKKGVEKMWSDCGKRCSTLGTGWRTDNRYPFGNVCGFAKKRWLCQRAKLVCPSTHCRHCSASEISEEALADK